MFILIPVDANDIEEAKLTKLSDVKFWIQLQIEEGRVVNGIVSSDKDSFENLSEAVVVIDDNEYVWPFIELSMMVLVAHTQRYIDDIVEAYIFKELHDLAY